MTWWRVTVYVEAEDVGMKDILAGFQHSLCVDPHPPEQECSRPWLMLYKPTCADHEGESCNCREQIEALELAQYEDDSDDE